ncbi:MAG: four helix bundle protein [Planctomycetota bacterium]|nr:four helix bundle protein [Planctomycetota bacterium]MDA0918490.1 four helix bundle protein [Planctomycetota bacterium]MDA1160091.1 four helix bundle protein [Planctomycetota bacterium]
MADIRNHRDLVVWQKSMGLVVSCYELTREFPKSETYGLSSQLQRAAVSVPANIAEGHGRGSTKAFINYLWIANGSLTELETHILIAERLGFSQSTEITPIIQATHEVGRMLVGLRRSLEARNS